MVYTKRAEVCVSPCIIFAALSSKFVLVLCICLIVCLLQLGNSNVIISLFCSEKKELKICCVRDRYMYSRTPDRDFRFTHVR